MHTPKTWRRPRGYVAQVSGTQLTFPERSPGSRNAARVPRTWVNGQEHVTAHVANGVQSPLPAGPLPCLSAIRTTSPGLPVLGRLPGVVRRSPADARRRAKARPDNSAPGSADGSAGGTTATREAAAEAVATNDLSICVPSAMDARWCPAFPPAEPSAEPGAKLSARLRA